MTKQELLSYLKKLLIEVDVGNPEMAENMLVNLIAQLERE